MNAEDRQTDASPEIPQSLRALMAEVGPRWGKAEGGPGVHVQLMVDRFSELLSAAPKRAQVTRDIAYGGHPRQVLDVYAPPEPVRGAAVVIFVHGGAFTDGDKDRSPEVFANVGWYFARHGVVAINLEYRLAPQHRYPSGTEDMAAAVAWTRANAARFGADPRRVYLMGHSAGGAHGAHYAYDRRFHPAGGPGIAGLIVVSGRVRAETLAENPNARRVEAYYGDAARMEEGSGVNHVGAESVRTFIAIAEYENPLIDVHCAELFSRLAAARRRAPPILRLAGHNHTSIIAHMNTAEDRLGREIRAFIGEQP
jgi:acetyl esterase